MSPATRLTGGQILARTLKAAGVNRAFALHGGHLEALLKGCLEEGIALTDFRHESSAGHAADAHARITGELGVCMITSGPGFTNGISAMANAKLDGSPVLFIVGAPPFQLSHFHERKSLILLARRVFVSYYGRHRTTQI